MDFRLGCWSSKSELHSQHDSKIIFAIHFICRKHGKLITYAKKFLEMRICKSTTWRVYHIKIWTIKWLTTMVSQSYKTIYLHVGYGNNVIPYCHVIPTFEYKIYTLQDNLLGLRKWKLCCRRHASCVSLCYVRTTI